MHGQEQTRVRKHNRSAALPWHICVPQVYRIGVILPNVLQSLITDPTGVPMHGNTRRRLRTALLLMLVCVPVALCYEFIDSTLSEDVEGKISFVGLIIGIVLALPLALFEESRFDERMRRLPFAVAVIVKSLVFNGDVLNTGARIQGECGRLEKRLLSSAVLFNRLTLPEGWTAEELGPTNLRGKSAPVELVAFA